jgi:DNA-binding Xre family transcriptional regulator
MIVYAPFWETLERKQVSTYTLIEKHRINPNTLTRMRANKYLSMRTVDDLCKILDCRIEEIAEYIPDKRKTETP